MPFPEPERIRLPSLTTPRGAELESIELSVHVAGEGPTVVLCHGFPELAYSWRHQFGALVEAGYRVIAPDMRGYGASDRPASVDAYDLEHLTGDLVRLLDHFEVERAIFAGHDWGGFVIWAMPIAWPSRVAGLIGVNTPNRPMPTTALMRAMVADPERLYLLWFQEPGVAEAKLDPLARMVFEKMMRRAREPEGPGGLAAAVASGNEDFDGNPFRRIETIEAIGDEILSSGELETYVEAFERTGFEGGINWYRNIDRNAEVFPGVGATTLKMPCLMITAEWDLALPPAFAEGMESTCLDLELHMIKQCGHWTQHEKPEELNALLVDFLTRRFPA
jgi:pimeloyl-ACP methyl ester carboxylesterase